MSQETIIDLTLSSEKIVRDISGWAVLDEESFSDHKIIKFEIKTKESDTTVNRIKKRTDWIKLSINLDKNLKGINLEIHNQDDLETTAKFFSDAPTNGSTANLMKKNKN